MDICPYIIVLYFNDQPKWAAGFAKIQQNKLQNICVCLENNSNIIHKDNKYTINDDIYKI